MPQTRRPHAAAIILTAALLASLAGCAADSGAGAAGKPAGSTSVAAKTEAAKTESKPAAESLDRPGAYSVIDGKKAAIPAIPMGEPATIARIIDEGKNRNHVWDQISYISSEIGPRLTGSSNAEKANKWARDQFAKWGLSIPAFGGYKDQTSTDPDLRGLWQWGEIATRFDRGPCKGQILTARNAGSENPEFTSVRDMEFTTPAWSIGTSGPVRGEVIKLPTTDEQFEAVKDKIKGSWILLPGNRGGRRGVMGASTVRAQTLADIRKRWKGEAAPEKPQAQADKDATHYDGTMAGGPIPEPTPFTLDVNLTDPKNVSGTFSIGGFMNAPLKEGTFDAASHELKFKTETPRGERSYTMKLEGDTIKGEAPMGEAGTITYTGKKGSAAAPAEPKGPSMEERILALGPAGWISPANGELVLTGGVPGWDKIDPDSLPPDIIVTVRQSDYDCMNSKLADGVPVQAEFDLQAKFTKGPIPTYDTIAEIKGSTWPDEVVIVSGHLDSWNGPGSQGTTDNGTGSAVTLEAARILAATHARPKRTIRFILWTGEEQGLLGSVSYVKYLKDHGQLDKVSAVLVDDGGTNYEGGLPCVHNEVEYLAAATAPVNGHFFSKTDNKMMDVNIHETPTFTQVMGSDHNSFMREHIPGFFWDEVGRADYNHTHHTQYDRLDQAIPEYLQQSATCMAITAYNLACAPAMLPRPADDQWGGRGGGGGGGQRRNRDGGRDSGPGNQQRPPAGGPAPTQPPGGSTPPKGGN